MTLEYPLFMAVFIIGFISFCFLCDDIAIGCILHVIKKSINFTFVFHRVIRIKMSYSVVKGRLSIYQFTTFFLVTFMSQNSFFVFFSLFMCGFKIKTEMYLIHFIKYLFNSYICVIMN